MPITPLIIRRPEISPDRRGLLEDDVSTVQPARSSMASLPIGESGSSSASGLGSGSGQAQAQAQVGGQSAAQGQGHGRCSISNFLRSRLPCSRPVPIALAQQQQAGAGSSHQPGPPGEQRRQEVAQLQASTGTGSTSDYGSFSETYTFPSSSTSTLRAGSSRPTTIPARTPTIGNTSSGRFSPFTAVSTSSMPPLTSALSSSSSTAFTSILATPTPSTPVQLQLEGQELRAANTFEPEVGSLNGSSDSISPSPPATAFPSVLPINIGAAPRKAFPHTADLLGSPSERDGHRGPAFAFGLTHSLSASGRRAAATTLFGGGHAGAEAPDDADVAMEDSEGPALAQVQAYASPTQDPAMLSTQGDDAPSMIAPDRRAPATHHETAEERLDRIRERLIARRVQVGRIRAQEQVRSLERDRHGEWEHDRRRRGSMNGGGGGRSRSRETSGQSHLQGLRRSGVYEHGADAYDDGGQDGEGEEGEEGEEEEEEGQGRNVRQRLMWSPVSSLLEDGFGDISEGVMSPYMPVSSPYQSTFSAAAPAPGAGLPFSTTPTAAAVNITRSATTLPASQVQLSGAANSSPIGPPRPRLPLGRASPSDRQALAPIPDTPPRTIPEDFRGPVYDLWSDGMPMPGRAGPGHFEAEAEEGDEAGYAAWLPVMGSTGQSGGAGLEGAGEYAEGMMDVDRDDDEDAEYDAESDEEDGEEEEEDDDEYTIGADRADPGVVQPSDTRAVLGRLDQADWLDERGTGSTSSTLDREAYRDPFLPSPAALFGVNHATLSTASTETTSMLTATSSSSSSTDEFARRYRQPGQPAQTLSPDHGSSEHRASQGIDRAPLFAGTFGQLRRESSGSGQDAINGGSESRQYSTAISPATTSSAAIGAHWHVSQGSDRLSDLRERLARFDRVRAAPDSARVGVGADGDAGRLATRWSGARVSDIGREVISAESHRDSHADVALASDMSGSLTGGNTAVQSEDGTVNGIDLYNQSLRAWRARAAAARRPDLSLASGTSVSAPAARFRTVHRLDSASQTTRQVPHANPLSSAPAQTNPPANAATSTSTPGQPTWRTMASAGATYGHWRAQLVMGSESSGSAEDGTSETVRRDLTMPILPMTRRTNLPAQAPASAPSSASVASAADAAPSVPPPRPRNASRLFGESPGLVPSEVVRLPRAYQQPEQRATAALAAETASSSSSSDITSSSGTGIGIGTTPAWNPAQQYSSRARAEIAFARSHNVAWPSSASSAGPTGATAASPASAMQTATNRTTSTSTNSSSASTGLDPHPFLRRAELRRRLNPWSMTTAGEEDDDMDGPTWDDLTAAAGPASAAASVSTSTSTFASGSISGPGSNSVRENEREEVASAPSVSGWSNEAVVGGDNNRQYNPFGPDRYSDIYPQRPFVGGGLAAAAPFAASRLGSTAMPAYVHPGERHRAASTAVRDPTLGLSGTSETASQLQANNAEERVRMARVQAMVNAEAWAAGRRETAHEMLTPVAATATRDVPPYLAYPTTSRAQMQASYRSLFQPNEGRDGSPTAAIGMSASTGVGGRMGTIGPGVADGYIGYLDSLGGNSQLGSTTGDAPPAPTASRPFRQENEHRHARASASALTRSSPDSPPGASSRVLYTDYYTQYSGSHSIFGSGWQSTFAPSHSTSTAHFPPSLNLGTAATLRPDMSASEKRAFVAMISRATGRLSGSSRRGAAETVLSTVKYQDWEKEVGNLTTGQNVGTTKVQAVPLPVLGQCPYTGNAAAASASMKSALRGIVAGMEKEAACSICHDDYEPDSDITVTPCKHSYHKDCLEMWLNQPNATTASCPMCRRDMAVLACLARFVPDHDVREAHTVWMGS